MDARGRGDFQLCTHTVCTGDEHRLTPALDVQGKEPAEGADAAHHATREGTRGHAADTFLGLFGARDIHAGFGIAHCFEPGSYHPKTRKTGMSRGPRFQEPRTMRLRQ